MKFDTEGAPLIVGTVFLGLVFSTGMGLAYNVGTGLISFPCFVLGVGLGLDVYFRFRS